MKAKEIIENAIALCIGADFNEEINVRDLNGAISITFNANNSIRERKGKPKLSDVPYIDTMADDLLYENELYSPLSYLLASLILIGQEEHTLANLYRQQYLNLINMFVPPQREIKRQTNFERIKAMTVEEFIDWCRYKFDCTCCPAWVECGAEDVSEIEYCKLALRNYLESEVQEE